jgi:hypothetical protein
MFLHQIEGQVFSNKWGWWGETNSVKFQYIGGNRLYFYREDLINIIVPDKPDPAAAKVLQEALGGRFGEMRTMMQFFFQSSNFRGNQKQYRDLIRGIFRETPAGGRDRGDPAGALAARRLPEPPGAQINSQV